MLPPIALVTRMDEASEQDWLDRLAKAMPEETIRPFRLLTPEERRLAEIAIVANPDPADVAALPCLSWIHSLWAGVERLVAELGGLAPPIVRLVDPELSRVMAEAVLAWTYYIHRDMPAYRKSQQNRLWQPLDYRHPRDVTVGLLGLGALGTAAADRLTGAGFKVCGWSRSPKVLEGVETVCGDDGLRHVLATSDIVICLVPLTSNTRGLLNAERLASIKPGASIINFARGAVIVGDPLLAALDSGRITHAVLDVFEQEPLPADARFWGHDRVTVLPHISAPTTPETACAIVAANVHAWRDRGVMPATVDRDRGY